MHARTTCTGFHRLNQSFSNIAFTTRRLIRKFLASFLVAIYQAYTRDERQVARRPTNTDNAKDKWNSRCHGASCQRACFTSCATVSSFASTEKRSLSESEAEFYFRLFSCSRLAGSPVLLKDSSTNTTVVDLSKGHGIYIHIPIAYRSPRSFFAW